MIWIILIGILILFVIMMSSGNNQNNSNLKSNKSFEAEIEVPNPENSNPKKVIEFIDHYSNPEVIKSVYEKLIELDKKIPPILDAAFKEKIQNGYITKEIYLWNLSIENRKIIEDELENYPNSYKFELKGLQENKYVDKLKSNIIYDEVWLYEEPNNKFDKNAIKVQNLIGTIGYVPKDETFEVKEILQEDFKAYINKIERQENYLFAEIIIHYK
ncbi:HIRAN domain-containing protein [Kaistella palustris]|uniref:HIRAN domain-containing protein n=1 Tax=Kaistella palustris TaxID=493376 RepID=UPI0012EB2DC5|nr:HIRAN domain-containing protein [Kaistella palustris]